MINDNDKNDDNDNCNSDNNTIINTESNSNDNMKIMIINRKKLKIIKNVKSVCFHVIPHIHEEFFPYILLATITTFPGTSLISSN